MGGATVGYGPSGGEYGGGLFGSFLPGGDLFSDSEFELNRESRGGVVSISSRGSRSYFRGMEGRPGRCVGVRQVVPPPVFAPRSIRWSAVSKARSPRDSALPGLDRGLAARASDHKSPLRILRRQRRRITDTSSYSRRLGVSKVRTSSSFLAGVAAT